MQGQFILIVHFEIILSEHHFDQLAKLNQILSKNVWACEHDSKSVVLRIYKDCQYLIINSPTKQEHNNGCQAVKIAFVICHYAWKIFWLQPMPLPGL